MPFPYAITYAWEVIYDPERRRQSTHVNTTLNVELYTAFKAIASMHCIVEIFVVAAKAEPSLRVPCPCGLFKVAEGGTGIVWNVIRVCPRRSERGAMVNRLRSKDGDWIRVLCGRELKDQRDRDLYETQELRILYDDGSNRGGII